MTDIEPNDAANPFFNHDKLHVPKYTCKLDLRRHQKRKPLIENNCLSRESRLKLNRRVTLDRLLVNGLCLAHFNI